MEVILFLFLFIIGPVLGILLLPFTPYLVKRVLYKDKNLFPSFVPFWATILPLVLMMSWIWAKYFNGRIFYDWDTNFVEYSLVSYQKPLLDGSGTWIAKGWQEWYLYLLWMGITTSIYVVGVTVALYVNRKKKNFLFYRRVIITSSLVMLITGLILAPILSFF